MARGDAAGYWRATRLVMLAAVLAWLVLGLGAYMLAARLTDAQLFGFPVGYLLAGLVAPVGLVGLLFWFADRQDRIDRDYGMAEED